MPQIQEAPAKYLQIAGYLRDQIIRGDLPPGAEVPSERQIAEEWGSRGLPRLGRCRRSGIRVWWSLAKEPVPTCVTCECIDARPNAITDTANVGHSMRRVRVLKSPLRRSRQPLSTSPPAWT